MAPRDRNARGGAHASAGGAPGGPVQLPTGVREKRRGGRRVGARGVRRRRLVAARAVRAPVRRRGGDRSRPDRARAGRQRHRDGTTRRLETGGQRSRLRRAPRVPATVARRARQCGARASSLRGGARGGRAHTGVGAGGRRPVIRLGGGRSTTLHAAPRRHSHAAAAVRARLAALQQRGAPRYQAREHPGGSVGVAGPAEAGGPGVGGGAGRGRGRVDDDARGAAARARAARVRSAGVRAGPPARARLGRLGRRSLPIRLSNGVVAFPGRVDRGDDREHHQVRLLLPAGALGGRGGGRAAPHPRAARGRARAPVAAAAGAQRLLVRRGAGDGSLRQPAEDVPGPAAALGAGKRAARAALAQRHLTRRGRPTSRRRRLQGFSITYEYHSNSTVRLKKIDIATVTRDLCRLYLAILRKSVCLLFKIN